MRGGTGAVALGVALVGWTVVFAICANFGRFAVSDHSCDGGDLRPSSFGIVYLVVGAVVWLVPFITLTVKTRSVAATVLVVVAAAVATVVVVTIPADPGEFCW